MVTLVPMTADEFTEFLASSIEHYANEKVIAGNWREEEALDLSKREFEQLLPNGVKSKDHYLYTIFHQEEPVGIIWLAKKSEEKGFIYEIKISEKYQGKGFGKSAMLAIEEVGKQLGLKKIGLHVFGHNKRARGLYENIGYNTLNVVMEKVL